MTLIARRLENFIEAAPGLNNGQLFDVQVYIDHIRAILESGQNASKDRLDEVLATLPTIGVAPTITRS